MSRRTVLVFSPEPARLLASELAAAGVEVRQRPLPAVTPPPDARAWQRSVSELALFNWLLLPTKQAAEALLEAAGAPPGPMLRVATVEEAGSVLRAHGRVPEVEGASLGELLERLSGRLGRRQRTLVAHATVAGRQVGGWLETLGAEAVCRAAYDLRLAAGQSDGDEPERYESAAAAVVATPAEAEALACYLRAGRFAPRLPIIALDRASLDAVEDCDLAATLLPESPAGGRLGPLLGETLS